MIDLAEALAIAETNYPKGPESLAAHMGIEVRYKKLAGCAGWCVRNHVISVITINSQMPVTRQRFTLAHELAHLLLGSEPEIRSDKDLFGSSDGEEKSADQLAAQLLLPQTQLEAIVSNPPIESATIKKLAKNAQVSEVMAACRVTGLAQAIGLINAAVVCFENLKVKWVWSKTLEVPHDEACNLLKKATETTRGVYRGTYHSDEIIIASTIGHDLEPCLFIQLLPAKIGNRKNDAEIIGELDAWLFGSDKSFRGQVNGCLSSFKKIASHLNIDSALEHFNAKYLLRWTGPMGSRIRDPRGQTFLRLRLSEWTLPAKRS